MTESWTADWPYRLNDDDGGRTCSPVVPLNPLLGHIRVLLPLPDDGYDYMVDPMGRFVRRPHPRRPTLLAIWALADELNADPDVSAFMGSRSAIGFRVSNWIFGLRHHGSIGAASYERHWLRQLHDATLDLLLLSLKRTQSKLATPALRTRLREAIQTARRLRDELLAD